MAVAALAGCGGGSPAAVHVGQATISEKTVSHWSSIARGESAVALSNARQRALEFLIFSHWLLGEASQRHVAPTQAQVSRRLEATRAVLIGGSESSYIRKLKASKRTAADLRFEIETELAYLHLREAVLAAGSTVTSGWWHRTRCMFPGPEPL